MGKSREMQKDQPRFRITELSAFLLGIIITFLIVFLIVFAGLFIQDRRYRDSLYRGVLINGRDAGGARLQVLTDLYRKQNKELSQVKVELGYDTQTVATFSGELLQLHTNGDQVVKQAYLIGRQGTWMTRLKQKLQILLRVRTFEFETRMEYEDTPIVDTLRTLELAYNVEPKNALFELKKGRVTAFAKEKNGLALNTDEILQSVRARLHADPSVILSKAKEPLIFTVIARIRTPDIPLASANTQGISELIGIGESDYTHSIPERIHNLLLASDRLHGVIVPRGEIFSYNDTIGEISGRTGYKPAYVIVDGRTVLGDGGGVCQTSTTLFRAAINTGLPITGWTAHAYRVGYYENDSKPGRDATVYAPSVDLKFRNDTPASILIQVIRDEEHNKLTYQFWGKKDERKIQISDVSMGAPIPAPPPRYQDDPTLKKGVTRQVDFAAGGLRAWFDYKVTQGDKISFEKTFVSNYRPWQAVYLVGTGD